MRTMKLAVILASLILLPGIIFSGPADAQSFPDRGFVAQYGGPYGPGGPYGGYGPYAGYGPYGGYMGGPGPSYSRGARASMRARGSANYGGFRIKLAHSAGSSDGARELAGVQNQIDIVRRSGLRGSDLALFRRQSIGYSARSRSHDGNSVELASMQPGDTRPVLLHEYMHVYHHTRLPGGYRNPTIKRFYEEALANNLFPQGSYMMKNHLEFFAMTASAYLNGTVARPPYTREAIQAAQPAYYAYLAHLFGPR